MLVSIINKIGHKIQKHTWQVSWLIALFLIINSSLTIVKAQVSIPPSNGVSYTIEVTENQTTHVVFESDITYIDVGDNNNFVADYTNAILRIKGRKYAQTTNLTVVTKEMNYYSFMVKYVPHPKLNYFVAKTHKIKNISPSKMLINPIASNPAPLPSKGRQSINNQINSSPKQSRTTTVEKVYSKSPKLNSSSPIQARQSQKNSPASKPTTIAVVKPNKTNERGQSIKSIEDLEKSLPKEERALQEVRRLAQYALTDKGRYEHIKGKHGDIRLKVIGIYHSLHNCYIKYEIENMGEVPYDIRYVEFGMREKKRPKRTALNDQLIEPFHILNGDRKRVLPFRKNRYVAILGKVAVPEGRTLYMEVVEHGRNIPLKIPYNKVKKQFIQ